jgi:hypothetical protein
MPVELTTTGVDIVIVTVFPRYSRNIDTYICINIYLYKHTHKHSISMSTFKRLSQFNLKIHKIGHQECIAVNRDITSH